MYIAFWYKLQEYVTLTAKCIKIEGKGAYLGLPKVVNLAELTAPADAPDEITYIAVLNGGLPAWKEKRYEVVKEYQSIKLFFNSTLNACDVSS